MTAFKVFSFATMMVLAQRRHAARMAAQEAREVVARPAHQPAGPFFHRLVTAPGNHAQRRD
jgi:hypothetical protein